MKPLNNIDAALTADPAADQWADHDEPTEATTPSKLIVGPKADDLFSTAHAAGAALRATRRRAEQSEVPTAAQNSRRWSLDPEVDYDALLRRLDNGEPLDCGYYDLLELMKRVSSGRRTKQHLDVTPEWREMPNYPGYEMNSVSRRIRHLAYDAVLRNGIIRHYETTMLSEKKSYSLRVNGVTYSRGVNGLWAETFPEYSKPKNAKREVGEWAGEVQPHRDEFSYYHGLAEWVGDGAGIETRPK